jgi:hypothetical protein
MIETGQIFPGLHRVAGFATEGATKGIHGLHARNKLVAVRIGVTGCTRQLAEVIQRNC